MPSQNATALVAGSRRGAISQLPTAKSELIEALQKKEIRQIHYISKHPPRKEVENRLTVWIHRATGAQVDARRNRDSLIAHMKLQQFAARYFVFDPKKVDSGSGNPQVLKQPANNPFVDQSSRSLWVSDAFCNIRLPRPIANQEGLAPPAHPASNARYSNTHGRHLSPGEHVAHRGVPYFIASSVPDFAEPGTASQMPPML